jgi:hypothetical protein
MTTLAKRLEQNVEHGQETYPCGKSGRYDFLSGG